MIKIGKLLILLGLTSGFVACSRGFDEPVSQTGTLKTTLSTKSQISYPETSDDIDLSQLKVPSSSDFKVDILAEDEVVQSFEKFSDLPQSLELQLGKYKLKSVYGDNAKSGWNSVYYVGENDFLLSMTQNQANVLVECKLLSSFAYAKFDAKFRAAFRDFNVEFSTEKTPDPLVFVDGEKRIASFTESEKLWIVVTGVLNSTGKKFKYGITHLEGVKAGDLNVFNFTVNDGTISANVTVDNGVNVVKKTIDLDPSWVDDRFTKVYSSFDTDKPILFVAGMPSTKSYDVVIATNVGLKNLVIHFDEQFAADLGGVDKVDMLNLTPEMKTLVDTKVGAVLKTTADGKGYRLNFSGCKDKLHMRQAGKTDYGFKINYIDNLNNEWNCNMNVILIEIKVNEFKDNRVWNRFAYIPDPYIEGGIEEIEFKYWLRIGEGEWMQTTPSKVNGEAKLENLTPATKYFTKVTFEDFTLSECGFVTHSENQIPNNDFSQFAAEQCGGMKYPYYTHEFVSSWATLNALSVDKNEAAWARSFPSVRAIDGSAEISTIGYGKNSDGGSAQINHAWTQSIEKKDKWSRTWGNYVVGKLFLGTYSVANGEVKGKEFDSKPTAIKFKYKFKCKNPNGPWNMQLKLLSIGGEEIGKTEFGGSNVNQNSFVELSVPIIYNANYNSKTITNVELYFVSQTGSVEANSGNLDEIYGQHRDGTADFWGQPNWKESLDSRTCGNVLTIDDVIMVYPNKPEDYQIR